MEEWVTSPCSRASPDSSTHKNKLTLASKVELERRAAGERKVGMRQEI
jgi:hypothetical protein